MGSYGDPRSCYWCGRTVRRTLLVVTVDGRLWTAPQRDWFMRDGDSGLRPRLRVAGNREHFEHRPIARRMSARCMDRRSCLEYRERKRERARRRAALPEDAVLRELAAPERGVCRWCREPIFMLAHDGHVRRDNKGRMWHEARLIHPDAEPEPDCRAEYYAQAFSFRDQVFHRDRGVCAACGLDTEAARLAWEDQRPGRGQARAWYALGYERRGELTAAWQARRPVGWEADHIVPLEDDGPHLLSNAQTLCVPCHGLKTGAENSARADRRREELGDSRSLR